MPLQLNRGRLVLGSGDSEITLIASDTDGLKIMSGEELLMIPLEPIISLRQNGTLPSKTQYKTKQGFKMTSIKLFFQQTVHHDILNNRNGWVFITNPSENSVLMYTTVNNAIEASDWSDLYIQESVNSLINADNGSNELAQAIADESINIISQY